MLASVRLDIARTYRIDIPIFDLEDALPTNVGGLTLEHVDYYPDQRLGVQIRYGTATTVSWRPRNDTICPKYR